MEVKAWDIFWEAYLFLSSFLPHDHFFLFLLHFESSGLSPLYHVSSLLVFNYLIHWSVYLGISHEGLGEVLTSGPSI